MYTDVAHSFDKWGKWSRYSEVNFHAGGFNGSVLVSTNGVGFWITSGVFHNPRIKIYIDEIEYIPSKITLKTSNLAIVDWDLTLYEKFANLKKLKIEFSKCEDAISTCHFSSSGIPNTLTWEFEDSLSTSFPQYSKDVKFPR